MCAAQSRERGFLAHGTFLLEVQVMESENSGRPVGAAGERAGDAQAAHPADHQEQLAAALDLYAQDPEAARARYPEFVVQMDMLEGPGGEAGEEVL